ncbi:MAG: ATP synthase F1 subunit gamma [Longimicrobiales bacterium]|nr:ATP synthase F1 subunit gamma [Longimicrobiales bacterium]
MQSAKEVRRRIKSVDNTKQITKTMEMVATSKLKRATDRVRAARPYGEALGVVVKSLYAPEFAERFPVLRQPERIQKVAIVLMTANRGLCGGFNANLIREARVLRESLREKGIDPEIHSVGRKGMVYFQFRKVELASRYNDVGDTPTVEDAERIIGPLRERFEAGEVDQVLLVSAEYRSALSTPPQVVELLPIRPEEGAASADSYLLSPSAQVILTRLLPAYIRNTVYKALVENAAAEHGARRTAMKSATDNAGEMLETLTRNYNRARQAQITQEISEIVGGAEGLS